MAHSASVLDKPLIRPDYSLTGVNATLAVEKGLAEADWYQCSVPRETMRKLLVRRNGPAIRDTILWFALLFAAGFATYARTSAAAPAWLRCVRISHTCLRPSTPHAK